MDGSIRYKDSKKMYELKKKIRHYLSKTWYELMKVLFLCASLSESVWVLYEVDQVDTNSFGNVSMVFGIIITFFFLVDFLLKFFLYGKKVFSM